MELSRVTAWCITAVVLVSCTSRAAAAQSVDCTGDSKGGPGGIRIHQLCWLDELPRPRLDVEALADPAYAPCVDIPLRLTIDSKGSVVSADRVDRGQDASQQCLELAAGWEFSPGRRFGRALATRMQVRLRRDSTSARDMVWDPVVTLLPAADSLFDISVIRQAPDQETYRPLSAATEDSATAAVVREVATLGFTNAIDHHCFDLSGETYRVARTLVLIGQLERPVYLRAACPSIHTIDGRVAYRTDKPYLHVGVRGEVVRASRDAVVIDAWYARGLGGAGYLCRAARATPRWQASCVELWSAN